MNSIETIKKLNRRQKEVSMMLALSPHVISMFKFFVKADEDLLISNCGCCKKKRAVARKIYRDLFKLGLIHKLPEGA